MSERAQVRAAGLVSPKAQGAMAELSHDELARTQQETLAAPRRRYSLGAKALFALLDGV